MTDSPFAEIEKLEKQLWRSADELRANANLSSSSYFMPVLGIVFLRHAHNRFAAVERELQALIATKKRPARPIDADDFVSRRALFLPEKARYDFLVREAEQGGKDPGRLVNAAMAAIEDSFPPLKGVLPREYGQLAPAVLRELLRVFNSEELQRASGDVFGRIYEYFLAEFSLQKAHDNGEFFTPPSLVQTIVNVIEPDHGKILDPACGSGGMFVQSSHFIERTGADSAAAVTFYGHEKDPTTIRLAKMNLAVHGLEGHIAEAITYYQDPHTLVGRCDYVMANPPFNVDMVDAAKAKEDTRRLPFGLPGVNKDKKIPNANYLWISYFHAYLGPRGRAGFVMSSQASSAGRDEAAVRRELVKTGDVDAMLSIRSGFFYTRTVPCELWFLDKRKPARAAADARNDRDHVLFIDARGIHRKVTRSVYDFSPEQLAHVAAIVWLYRGQRERFARLLADHARAAGQQAAALARHTAATPMHVAQQVLDALAAFSAQLLTPRPGVEVELHPAVATLAEHLPALRTQLDALRAQTSALLDPLHDFSNRAVAPGSPAKPETLARTLATLVADAEPLLAQAHAARQAAEAFGKALDTALDLAAKELGLRRQADWKRDGASALERFAESLAQLGASDTALRYWHRQLAWLLHRFPAARYADVPGLCKAATLAEIEAADWSLTPGRYVGVAPQDEGDEDDFAERLREIHDELAELDEAAQIAAERIRSKLRALSE